MPDAYVVIHISTTCDEHGVYVTKDSAETIEIAWIVLDAQTLEETHADSVLVRPVNTPITPLCTSLTTLSWEHVRSAGSFRDAITTLETLVATRLSGKDFVFVTLTAWDLRVQLPREARDKAVRLPPFLQHPRAFELKTEFRKWQSHHPDTLSYNCSSLSNICAALHVDAVQSCAPIKHNLPVHLQSLATPTPRRAMEEAVTLARVLKALVRNCTPEDRQDVFVHPLDAQADFRAFLAERSKVLHMANLPHDTTQSELESWFTQYGGRPVAFWTLKTPDSHKSLGVGFAVFASHEEATESLAMNGRALNDRAIEVAPSSARVLDRAHEILAPFPPSKNRPRPGDWTCPSCGFSNFQRRTACFRCSFPAVSAQAVQDSLYGAAGQPGSAGSAAAGSAGPAGFSHYHRTSVPFRAGDWKCGNEGCAYHNFAKNVCCLRCGAARPQMAGHPHGHAGHHSMPMQMHGRQPVAQSVAQPVAQSGQPQSFGPGGGLHLYDKDDVHSLTSKLGSVAIDEHPSVSA